MELIFALIVIGVAVFFFLKKRNNDQPENNDKEPETPSNPVDEGINALLSANLITRKAAISEEIILDIETLIDELAGLLPRVYEASPTGELNWTINRMATDYLPEKLIKPYISLNKDEQASPTKIESVKAAIDAMKKELADVKELLNNRAEKDFDAKATFLKRRFEL